MNQLYLRDTWAEINLDAIASNVSNMIKYVPTSTQTMAVVKANAYGHGARQVAEVALESGAKWLGVALLDEAIALRMDGIKAPILVFGYVKPEDVGLAVDYNISLTFYQAEWLAQVHREYDKAYPLFLHLKCDTGMGRLGIRTKDEMDKIVDELKSDSRFILEGVFTHFATADEDDNSYFLAQYQQFEEMLSWLKAAHVHPNLIHCGNSAASLKQPDKMFNLIRFGISMYGLSPSPLMKNKLPFELKEAFTLHSRLTHVKKITKGECVSYGATYCAEEAEWIGTIPIGYADGWLRALGQCSEVLIQGRRHPLVGRICMDQCMCRLDQEVPVHEQVTLIGRQGDACISVDDIADRLQTINYEVTCMISERVPRIYFKNGEKKELLNPLLQRFSKDV